ncbi:phytanoyl-CoA dioxygenase family protein [Paraliomyxa miuraensis]|uniref:phytanoyl-CoA dioxygenase family protein n=1 Tax=Paraliomyxa miuraensis TaxID=376150 RepID=UPI002250DF2B|nr:phytanoyl-CoA dioxygenase family protein [Paraliomyxa miuraensis]MCX4247151.1 phytanoyl-CoA dioxygenase family protein [Paraliomyxa miuraensis]
MLTRAQAHEFDERGFLVLPRLLSPEQVDPLRRAALELVDAFDIDHHRTVFSTKDGDAGRDDYFFASAQGVGCFLEEDALDAAGALRCDKRQAINKIGHAMHDLVPAFREFCRLPAFIELLRDIGYRTPVLWQTMYIFKQPRIGGEVRWHQDATYLATEPNSDAGVQPRVTGMWVAIEDAHRGNGCLWVQPGGHRSPLRERFEVDWEHRRGTLRRLDDTPWPSLDRAEAVEVPAGSLVMFHDHLPHFSSQNTSESSRHAFTMHVAEQGASWSASNWLQRPRLGDFVL